MPQQLNLLDRPLPETHIWERLDPEPRKIFIEALARLIARAVISGAFDCYCIQRTVYNYRMEHASEPGPPEPLADLFAKDKLNCSQCIGQFVTMWATSHAQSQRLTLPVAQCVAKRFDTTLRAKPYPSHVKELFNGAIAACK